MNRKSNFLCLLIVMILCMAILIPFISNGGIESQQAASEVSSIEAVDFSWSSWYDEYDRDSDGENDTIEIWYEFSDFTSSGWVDFYIRMEIFYWNVLLEYWEQIDSDSEYFSEDVTTGEVYNQSIQWSAWYDGNYSFSINIRDMATDELVVVDTISWNDISMFTFLNEWERWTEEYDGDSDGNNDTIEIWYSFNFSFSDWVSLQIRIEIFHWIGQWEPIDYDYEYFSEDVTAIEVYNQSIQWRAWYDGNYSFSIRIQDDETGRTLIEEWVAWNDTSTFSYFYEYNRQVDKSDEDGDTWEDTISIEYSLNFSFSDWVDLQIRVEIFHWNGYWELIDYDKEYIEEDVTAGAVYNRSVQWSVWYDGDYNFSIQIRDYRSDRIILEEWVTWNGARALTLLEDWNVWLKEYDQDGNGCSDTIEVGVDLTFSYTGQVDIRFRVEIRYYDPDYGGWDWIDDLYERFEEDITAGAQHTWSLQWQARYSGNYELYVRIEEVIFDIPLIEENHEWFAACAFNPIKQWESWDNLYDKDSDGLIDSVEIGFDMLLSYTGSISIDLRAEIWYWNEEDQQWDNFAYYHDEFEGDVTGGNWYACSFEWSAWESGDYKFDIRIEGETRGVFIEETIYWDDAHAFKYLNDWNSGYYQYDEDTDGYNDTIEIWYEFKFTWSGQVDLRIVIEILYWDGNSWDYVNYISERFQEEVTEGDWYTWSCRWSATSDGDYQFHIRIREDYGKDIIEETIDWQNAYKYKLIEAWNIEYTEYDEDSDGNNDTIEIKIDMKFRTTGSVFLIIDTNVQLWNEAEQRWEWMEIYLYEFFEEDVVEDTWYTVTTVWSALYSGDYNFTVQVVYYIGFTTNVQIQESIAWSGATAYQGVEFEWDRVHDPDYDERPTDSIEVGFEFLFSNTGFVDFDIRLQILYLDHRTMTFNLITTIWDSFTSPVTEGIWYDWTYEWDLADSDYNSVYFFIRIYDGRARVIDDMVSLYWDEYEQEVPNKLIPIERPTTTTTTPTTEVPPTTSTTEVEPTTTTKPKITPGWTVATFLAVFLGIMSIRRLKRRIG